MHCRVEKRLTMKARLVKDTVCPMCGNATSKQIISNNLEVTKTIWELTLMVTLRNVYGFGNKRMAKFFDGFHETQTWFEEKSKLTDTNRDKYSNMDTVIVQMMGMLDGIDYKDILNLDGIVINGKDLVKIAEKISSDRKEGYKHG